MVTFPSTLFFPKFPLFQNYPHVSRARYTLKILRMLLEDFSSRSWPIRRILHVETNTRHCLIHVKRVNQLMPLPISKKKKKMKSLFFIGLIPCHFFFFFCNLCLISLGNICKWVEVLKPNSKSCEDEVAPTGCVLGHKMDMWQIKKISFSYASCDMLKGRV